MCKSTKSFFSSSNGCKNMSLDSQPRYIYIGHCYLSPSVMDQRSIIWTQRSNRLTELHTSNRSTPRAHPPLPRHPSDLAPPDQPATPGPAHPNPAPLDLALPDIAPLHPSPSRLPRRQAPLPATPHAAPPPTSAPTSPFHHLSCQRPCLLLSVPPRR
jgi:hypothetical protein